MTHRENLDSYLHVHPAPSTEQRLFFLLFSYRFFFFFTRKLSLFLQKVLLLPSPSRHISLSVVSSCHRGKDRYISWLFGPGDGTVARDVTATNIGTVAA